MVWCVTAKYWLLLACAWYIAVRHVFEIELEERESFRTTSRFFSLLWSRLNQCYRFERCSSSHWSEWGGGAVLMPRHGDTVTFNVRSEWTENDFAKCLWRGVFFEIVVEERESFRKILRCFSLFQTQLTTTFLKIVFFFCPCKNEQADGPKTVNLKR